MPKQTSKTNTSSTASYGQIQPQSNQYIDKFANWTPELDPTIPFRAAASRNRLNSSFLNPNGGYATPQMLEARRNAANRGIDEQQGMEMRAGQYDANNQRMGQLGSLAALMAPRIVQTGSTGTSNTAAGQNLFGEILDLGMGAASMALG